MESQSHTTMAFASPPGTASRCPFHDGPLTLDALLAELGAGNANTLDLALDLRHGLARREDAETCVQLALQLRHALRDAHYLAFYRVRLWLRRIVAVQVRARRDSRWSSFPLPLNSARLEEIENACIAAWAVENPQCSTGLIQVRFVFRAPVGKAEVPAAASEPATLLASR